MYDIDAAGRVAPTRSACSATTTLSSGRPETTWSPAPPAAAAATPTGWHSTKLLEFRSYINEGGKVLLAGDSAGQQYTSASTSSCTTPRVRSPAPASAGQPRHRACLPLFGSFFGGDTMNDVLQYYLGGYVAVANDGHVEAPRSTR